MPKITVENLERFFGPLNEAMMKWGINTPIRQAMFLAQVAHESGSLRYTLEIASGEQYEGRKDLGNVNPGDGIKFKGRGLIQITGRANYELYFKATGLPTNSDPVLLEGPVYASDSAGWFWTGLRNLSAVADQPGTWRRDRVDKKTGKVIATYDPFQWITYRINGGQNGITDRVRYFHNAKAAFGI